MFANQGNHPSAAYLLWLRSKKRSALVNQQGVLMML
jgi:hypothetical protein